MNSARLLICPGAQKAGTTWIHRVLRQHPEFWLPPQKELDYLFHFPPSREKYAARMGPKLQGADIKLSAREWIGIFLEPWDLARYPKLFEPAQERFSADVSPNYSRMSASEVRRAAAVVPAAKIVLTLRDPVERAWSHARNASKTWGMIDPAAKLERCSSFVTTAVCDLMSDYPRLVRDWRAAFGADQVAVVFYDDLAARPGEFINAVLAFVGASKYPESHFERLKEHHNPGEVLPVPDHVRQSLAARYEPMLDSLRKLLESQPSIGRTRPKWLAERQAAV